MEILTYNTSTKRGSNLAPFDKISKSGDGGGSGGSLDTKEWEVDRQIRYCYIFIFRVNLSFLQTLLQTSDILEVTGYEIDEENF